MCTHIAAVLFYLEAAAGLQGKQTSIQHKWIMPEYLPVKSIDFTSEEKKPTWRNRC